MNLKLFTPNARRPSGFRWRICRFAVGTALLLALPVLGQEKVSEKQFPPIALANHFSCQDPQPYLDLACGFLLQHNGQVYAVSAKHVLAALKLKGIKGVEHVCLEGPLKEWTTFHRRNRRAARGKRETVGKVVLSR